MTASVVAIVAGLVVSVVRKLVIECERGVA